MPSGGLSDHYKLTGLDDGSAGGMDINISINPAFGYSYIHNPGVTIMSDASTFQDRYHIRFKGRRTTVTLDKILSNLIAAEFGVMPDRTNYHSTVQQWLQATLTDKLGQNVPGGNSISQYARLYAIEFIAKRDLMDRVIDWRLSQGS